MRRFNHFRLRFGNLNGGFYDFSHFFNNWRANNRFDSGGDRDLSHHRLHLYFFLFALLFNLYILRTYNWIADQTLPEASSGDAHATVNGIGDWVG